MRVYKTEKNTIRRKAKKCGMNMSEYLRTLGIGTAVKEAPRRELMLAYSEADALHDTVRYELAHEDFDEALTEIESLLLRAITGRRMPMAVTKIWAIHDSVSRVVDYCTNPQQDQAERPGAGAAVCRRQRKNLDEGEQQYAVTGIGCRAESAAREMAAVQRRFGKAGGNVAYHAVLNLKALPAFFL